ncbi:hypothetical protein J2T12_000911 [Paenibacillus anaericanus]|nr:hypothetical protein [Paenibacillus anaericanus]
MKPLNLSLSTLQKERFTGSLVKVVQANPHFYE